MATANVLEVRILLAATVSQVHTLLPHAMHSLACIGGMSYTHVRRTLCTICLGEGIFFHTTLGSCHTQVDYTPRSKLVCCETAS